MSYRFDRRIPIAASAIALMTVLLPETASAQIAFGGPLADGPKPAQLCRDSGNGAVRVVTGDNDSCDDEAGFASTPATNLTFGLGGQQAVLDADGNATFRNHTEIGGDLTLNGSTAFDTAPQFNQGATFLGAATFNNGLTTSVITDNGALSVSGMTMLGGTLTAADINGTSIAVTGSANSGSIHTGSVNATSLFSSGGAQVQGFLTVNGGASLNGTTQISNAQAGNLAVLAGGTVNMGGNRVQNVGTPTAATDAANKAYVDAVAGNGNTLGQDSAAAFGGGSTYDPATGHLSAPTYTVGTANYNNVGDALNAANTSGLAYFHTNSTGPDSTATGVNSTAIGPDSKAGGAESFAAGNGAVASANGAVAVGQSAHATGVNAIAIGNGATASGSVAVGVGAAAANGGAAYGDRSTATGTNSVALGADASATAANAVAVGNGSTATIANTVSVGTGANQRRVVNVAAGVAASDAATVGQLEAGGGSVADALGGGSVALADGTISAPSYVLDGATYHDVGGALGGLSDRIDRVVSLSYDIRKEERHGIAAATAMASAPMPSAPGRTSWVANTGLFHRAVGFGGSVAHRFDTEMPLALTAGFAYAAGRNSVARVGVAGEF